MSKNVNNLESAEHFEPNNFELESFLPYRLSVLSNTISQGIAVTYEQPFNLSIHEWRVIAILGRYPGCTATDVIGYTAMDKVAVSRTVKRLIDKQLIHRKEHHNDRRCMILNLTQEGEHIYQQVIPAALSYEQALLNQLDQHEQQTLNQLLGKMQKIATQLLSEH